MATIPVSLGERAYYVQVGADGPEEISARLSRAIGEATGIAVLVDARVARASDVPEKIIRALSLAYPRVECLEVPSGEAGKTLAMVETSLEWLAAHAFDRNAAVIAIGGGATSDHAGFVAATYLRGIRFASCPTTLLAMADASIGGKTGINLRAGKNLAGAVHQPRTVVADLNWLGTLPRGEWASGYAEIVKCALIADRSAFERFFSAPDESFFTTEGVAPFLDAAIRVKADIVASDERERGRRMLLNFGHTFGHAVEAASGYAISHGAAVSLGMVAALELGVRRGVTDAALPAQAASVLVRLGLPVDWRHRFTPDVFQHLSADKKRVGDAIRFVFVRQPGNPLVEEVPIRELESLWDS